MQPIPAFMLPNGGIYLPPLGMNVYGDEYELIQPNGTIYEQIEAPIYPVEYNVDRIWSKLAPMTKVNIDDFSHANYYGRVQSGKTFVQFVILWFSVFKMEKGTVHMLMNSKNSIFQNIDRDYRGFLKTIEEICTSLGITDYKNYCFFYKPITKTFLKASESLGFSQSRHVVTVAINNPSQINGILRLPRNKRQSIIGDEADVFIMDLDTKTMPKNIQLYGEATNRYYFTATPFKIYNQLGMRFEHNESLPANPNYRGYDQVIRHFIGEDESIEMTLAQALIDVPFYQGKRAILVNIGQKDVLHQETKHKILASFPHVQVAVVNSVDRGRIFPVSKMFDQFAESAIHDTLVVVSGLMAARAVTFRTSKESPLQVHLAGMIYRPSKSADESTLTQSLRIYGNFDSGVPSIHMYTTEEVDKIIDGSLFNTKSMVTSVSPGLLSRECIRKAIIVPTGRKFASLDDTKRTRNTLIEMEFDSLSQAREAGVKLGTLHEKILTEGVVSVPTNQFEYGYHMQTPAEQHAIRTQLRDRLANFNQGHHVAWSQKRFQELFNIQHRQNNEQYRIAHYTCGNPLLQGPQTRMDCILWKADCENAAAWTDPTTLYLFETTKSTWKVWVPEHMKDLGFIRHHEEEAAH